VPTGCFNLASPVLTALDLVKYIGTSGCLNKIADAILKLTEKFTEEDLRNALIKEGRASTAQRLGFLLECLGYKKLALVIETWLKHKNISYVFMVPYTIVEKKLLISKNKNRRRKIIVNKDIRELHLSKNKNNDVA